MKALADRFLVRTFRFSSSTSRLSNPADLTFGGTQTRLAGAIQSARQELAGLPVSGLVLVTDGADTTTDASVADALLASKADALPVFTVGVGQETLAHDIQIGRVSTPRTALKGTSLLVDAVVTQTGYAGQTVTLDVEDGGRSSARSRCGCRPTAIPRRCACGSPRRMPARACSICRSRRSPARSSPQNNQRDVQIDVRDRRERILYFEGEPRFEMKFMRRAIADDPNLQLVTLQRTAENKYLRLDVDKPEELAAGFPKTREELFAYRRPRARQRRGERVHRRSAADDLGVRRRARRRPAAARRPARVRRRRLRRHAARRRRCRSCSNARSAVRRRSRT